MNRALRIFSRIVCLPLAAFFAFVGYWKALGPIEALTEHRAWVAGWPEWFARSVGWSEIACAVGLLLASLADLRRLAFWTALVLIANQLAALGVHLARSEAAAAAPQNLVLVAALAVVAFASHRLRDAAV